LIGIPKTAYTIRIDLAAVLASGNRSDLRQDDDPGFYSTPQMKTNWPTRGVHRVARRQDQSVVVDGNDWERSQHNRTTKQPALPELAREKSRWIRTGLVSGLGYLGPSQTFIFTAVWYYHV
jgi:hypothetical protein